MGTRILRISAVAGLACVLLLIALSVMKLRRGPSVDQVLSGTVRLAPAETAAYADALERANRVDSIFIASSIVFWAGLVIVAARRGSRAAALVVAVLMAIASALDVAENLNRAREVRAVLEPAVHVARAAAVDTLMLEGSLWATYLAAVATGISLGREKARWLRLVGLLGPLAGLAGVLGLRPAVLLWFLGWHLGGAIFLWREGPGR